ncbi:MAG: polysaccharide deacetylase family protein [Armatimonadota bacterium]
MNIKTRIFIITFLLLILKPVWSADYLNYINSAVTKLEAGAYDDAAAETQKAFTLDDSDPLAHYIMAVIYLHSGNLAAMEKQISRVLTVKADDWRAHYSLGLIDLLNRRYPDASKHFNDALISPDAEYEVKPLINYFDYLNGKSDFSKNTPFNTPLDLEIFAMGAMKSGKNDLTLQFFKQMEQFPEQPGLVENRSTIASFNPEKPLILPYIKLKWRPTIPKNAPVVSGVINLKGDAKASSGIEFVSVYIDDEFVGVTNSEPYEYRWDTTKYTNGLHQITMDGKSATGGMITTKVVWVTVKNADPYRPKPKEGKAVEALMARIWNMLRVAESRLVMHYNMGKLYIKSDDVKNAIRELEFVQGFKPGYLDSLKLLKELKGRNTGYREIYKGPTGSKMIALTFDDGPNERTQQMLDVLDQLKVNATFFIVGYVSETQSDIIKKMQASGHQIENHSYSHRRFNDILPSEIEPELTKGAAVVKSITGRTSLYFRPPGGHSTEAVKQAAARQGLTAVFWTIMCSPYEGGNYENMDEYILKNVVDGAIILMHNGEPATTSSLGRIVPQLRAKGYKFVTLDELLSTQTNASNMQ